MAKKVRKMLKMPMGVRGLAGLLGLIVGLLCLVPEIFFWVKSCFNAPQAPSKKAEEGDAEEQEKLKA